MVLGTSPAPKCHLRGRSHLKCRLSSLHRRPLRKIDTAVTSRRIIICYFLVFPLQRPRTILVCRMMRLGLLKRMRLHLPQRALHPNPALVMLAYQFLDVLSPPRRPPSPLLLSYLLRLPRTYLVPLLHQHIAGVTVSVSVRRCLRVGVGS